MRIAAGGYRNGKAITRHNGKNGTVAEQKIKIGRINARPYRIEE